MAMETEMTFNEHRCRFLCSAPEPGTSEIGSFLQGTELCPHDAFGDHLVPGAGAKATVHPGDHSAPIPDSLNRLHDPVGHDFRMLDVIRLRINDTWDQKHGVRETILLEYFVFVLMSGIGQF